VDWRSPLADLYYSGTQGETFYESPSGKINGELLLKRKFLIKDENLIDAFDEGINQIILKAGIDNSEESALMDEFLRINLEANVNHKLKDIVATIQKEQNDIIRAEKNKPLIVQGSAGSGKTTVALHRLAYLLYRYKNRLSGEDILVIAPNKLFLDYISEVLPNLGADNIKQKTFDEMALNFLKLDNKRFITKDEKLANVIEEKNLNKVKFITNSSK
jgi:DNA helicase-2/ATP-dependent DNA helicase PcrA